MRYDLGQQELASQNPFFKFVDTADTFQTDSVTNYITFERELQVASKVRMIRINGRTELLRGLQVKRGQH